MLFAAPVRVAPLALARLTFPLARLPQARVVRRGLPDAQIQQRVVHTLRAQG